jgi:hypothetical protein
LPLVPAAALVALSGSEVLLDGERLVRVPVRAAPQWVTRQCCSSRGRPGLELEQDL